MTTFKVIIRSTYLITLKDGSFCENIKFLTILTKKAHLSSKYTSAFAWRLLKRFIFLKFLSFY